MSRHRFVDYKIRPKGSPEVAYDPFLIIQMFEAAQREEDKGRAARVIKVYNLILKIGLEILPPKQRKIFYSVWVRSNGKLSKGIMEFSRKTGQSHYTNYNNFYKAMNSITAYLDKAGYTDPLIEYLTNGGDEDGDELLPNSDERPLKRVQGKR